MFKFMVIINGKTMARFALESDARMFCEAFHKAYPEARLAIEDSKQVYAFWN